MTTDCAALLTQEFPSIDNEMKQYIQGNVCMSKHDGLRFNRCVFAGILTEGIDDFESSDDLYEAIGEILNEVSLDKSEDDIR